MKILWRFLVITALILTLSLSLPAARASAGVNDFTVTDFSAKYYLSNDDHQGQLHIIEDIKVHFTDNNHGLLRAIPETYKDQSLRLRVNKVQSPSGAPASYTTYEQNGNKVLKIGDPNQTVTGDQEYIVDYTVGNVITFYGDHDELYWNANGTEWSQPFTHVTATLYLPSGVKLSSQGTTCFAGEYGSTNPCQQDSNGTTLTFSADNLQAGQTLTFVAGFQKGYFAPATWRDWVRENMWQLSEFIIPALALGGGGFIWWLKKGRDARGTGIIVPQYDAPDGLSPVQVDALMGFTADNRGLTATIIDLAIRKYLRIVETDSTKLGIIKNKLFRLELINKDWSALKPWERELMEGIFGHWAQRDAVDMSFLKNKLNVVADNVKRMVDTSLADAGYFARDPYHYTKFSIGGMALVVAIIVLRMRTGSLTPAVLGLIAGGIIFGIFYHFMGARTAKGVMAREHALGLKLYLEVAEKDRIKMLQSPDAPYAPKTDAPEHTVELFEKLLPYAIVLKVEDQWAKKFEGMYATPPDWYVGNYAAFNAGYLAGSLGGGFNSAMNSGFAAPRSSGGSGFGGGGFSGGGGGGGGGGGW